MYETVPVSVVPHTGKWVPFFLSNKAYVWLLTFDESGENVTFLCLCVHDCLKPRVLFLFCCFAYSRRWWHSGTELLRYCSTPPTANLLTSGAWDAFLPKWSEGGEQENKQTVQLHNNCSLSFHPSYKHTAAWHTRTSPALHTKMKS